ncbi:MAG: LysM peptidoglycan-binding domain-containing protein [Verrucomicrobiota bacterium]
MKITHYISLAVITSLAVSCTPKGTGGDGYDVSNPYAAPDYVDETGTPVVPNDVNPAYDAPAAYEDVAATTPEVTAPAAPASPKVHTVGRGDTLWGLSKQYGVPAASIKTANGLTRDTIVLGAKLTIPAN